MPSIQVKSVPPDVHAELRRRATAQGRSLQEYLLQLLEKETEHPPLDEVLDRIGTRSGGHLSLAEAAELVRNDRDGH